MISNGFISIGSIENCDYSEVRTEADLQRELEAARPDASPRAIGLFVGYWRRFVLDAMPGDVVVLPMRDRSVAIGEFTGRYHFVPEGDPRARHQRTVDWMATSVDRDRFEPDLEMVLRGRHTVQEFSSSDAAERLRALAQ